jgi:YVTN family beta-propeller protein
MARNPVGSKRIIVVLVVVIVAAGLLFGLYRISRPTQITVMVGDAESGAPLGDAYVEIQNSNGQALLDMVTLDDGTAGVKRLAPDELGYRVLARHIDYVPAVRRNVPLRLHETTEVYLPLRFKPGGRLYVGVDKAYVAVIDTASMLIERYRRGPEELRQWPIRSIQVDPNRPWIYASARYVGYMLEPAGMQGVAEIGLRDASDGFKLTDDGGHLLISIRNRRQIDIFDASTGADLGYVDFAPLPDDPRGLIPQGASAHVVGPSLVIQLPDSGFTAYSLDDLFVQAGVPTSWRWALLSADATKLYVGGDALGQVLRIDTETLAVEDRYVASPDLVTAALNPSGTELYVADIRFGSIAILDAGSFEVLGRIPVGRGPVAAIVSPDGQRLYVANGDSQDITAIDLASRSVIETIYLGERPYSLAVR